MKINKTYALVSILVLEGFLMGFLGGFYMLDNSTPISSDVNPFLDSNYTGTCDNLTLKNTAICLNNQVLVIFKFNLTDDARSLSYNELIKRGGDCKDWADYYVSIAPEGFYKTTRTFQFTKMNSHRVMILSNYEGYCILDQATYPVCNFFAQPQDIKKDNASFLNGDGSNFSLIFDVVNNTDSLIFRS